MKKMTMRDIATSFTATMFLVMAVSGVMMFFHFMDMAVKELHEILGLAFVGIVLLHVYVNWASMKNYFSKKMFKLSVVLISLISVAFIAEGLNKGENPKKVVITKVLKAPLTDSLKLFGGYDVAVEKLKAQKIEIANAKSIDAIAKANEISPYKIVAIITK